MQESWHGEKAILYQASALPAHHLVGPLVAALPRILLALTLGPSPALYTGLLYVLAQQIEASLVTPLVQQHTVVLPPALVMLAVVAFGLLFGLPGVLLATP
jgi:predicted PurR-regulated permease PerM